MPVPESEFDVVLRGYERDTVDALVQRAAEALACEDPAKRAAARDALRHARVPVCLRGYDRMQVDDHLARLAVQLDLRQPGIG